MPPPDFVIFAMSGSGKLHDPWDLATALSNPGDSIQPGHNLNLREGLGVYVGDFNEMNKLVGTSESPITIKPHQLENPIIDGSVYSRGQHLVIRDLEIKDADFLDRETLDGGSDPADIPNRNGIRSELSAANIKYINLIIHDTKEAAIADSNCPNIEFYGLVIYFNGWIGPDRGHGHGIYCGNYQSNGGQKKAIDCIIFWQFGYGIHFYASGPNGGDEMLYDLHVDGCTTFQNGIMYNPVVNYGNLIGGGSADTTVRISSVKNSCFYQDKLSVGGTSTGSTNFTLQDSVIVGDVTILIYDLANNPPVITGNKFYGTVTIKDGDNSHIPVDHETLFPDNEYFASGVPDLVRLRANQYNANLANLTIFNGAQAANIQVDVSSVFSPGNTIKAWNVQDLFVDAQTLVVAGDGTITVNMEAINRTVAAPQGRDAPATTYPSFGCFRLVRQ